MTRPRPTHDFRLMASACLVVTMVLVAIGRSVMAEAIEADSLNWCGTQKIFDAEMRARGLDPSASMAAACMAYGVCDDPEVRDGWLPDADAPITYIRLAIHTRANSDGSSPFTTAAVAQIAVDSLNAHYLPSRIQFDFTFDQVNESQWRLLGESEIDDLKNFSAIDPAHWLNIWVGNVEFNYSFGTFPFDEVALQPTGGVILGHFHWGGNFSAFAHEVGHCLGLWHPFHGVSEVTVCSACYERVDAPDRNVLGDYCSDTPPGPTWTLCSNAAGVDSCSGLPWGSTQPENYMGYAPSSCRNLFTPQQRGRMRCWIDNALSGWISGVLIEGDGVFGKAPLTVDLSAQTFRPVTAWDWDLGDQSAGNAPTVSHTYESPGVYAVGVEISTADAVYSDYRPDFIMVHDDTVAVTSVSGSAGTPIGVPVSYCNYVPVTEIILPVAWSVENNLRLDSISTSGDRGEDFDVQELLDVDNTFRRAAIHLTPSLSEESLLLTPGNGPVVTLWFTAQAEITDTTNITIESYGSFEPYFANPMSVYAPALKSGFVHAGTCCTGRVGDVNGQGGDEPTIGDVSGLIDMLFISGVPLQCLPEGDINQSGGLDPVMDDITIGDISMLIDYLFITGPTLGLADCL